MFICLIYLVLIIYVILFFKAIMDDFWLCHRRLCHASIKTLRMITQKDIVRDIPNQDLTKH